MRLIQITQGKCAAIVDNDDYAYLMQWRWCYDGVYAFRNGCEGYTAKRIFMHRKILERMGFRNFTFSDHVNRNGLDNRRCNLRPATYSQSSWNRGIQKNNTSGYIGVSRKRRKWRVQINVNGRKRYLGCYDDPKEAAKVYNKAAFKYRGEFAVLNEV